MANASIVISAKNNLKGPVKQAESDLQGFGQVAEKLGGTLKKAFTATAIIASIKKLGDALKGCFEDFNEAERKYKQLALALGDTKAYDSAVKKIKELQKITLSSKDEIESMVSELAGLGYSSIQIDKISEAAVHLSNVTGKDLNSAMVTLRNTYVGNTTQLKKMGIDVSNLTKAELEQGAAVDLVIQKYGELSREMAAGDTTQRLKNIKDNIGDIKQSIGDLVNHTIAPIIAKLDVFFSELQPKVDNFVQILKGVFDEFPAVWDAFLTGIKTSLANLFSIEGIKKFIDAVWTYFQAVLTRAGNIIANIGNLLVTVIEEALKGLGNYAMYWITHLCDEAGINISEVINSIGNWLLESPIGKIVDQIISKAVNGVRLVLATIKNIPEILRIIFKNAADLVKELITSLPSAISSFFKFIYEKAVYIIQNIKNNFLQMIEDAINGLVSWLPDWVKNLLGVQSGLVDFNIDRTKEREANANANNAWNQLGNSFSGLAEIGKGVGEEIAALMQPEFEEFVANNSTTIGMTLAKWTAKTSDTYFENAQKNFSNISDFMKSWGKDMLGDLSADTEEWLNSMSGVFDSIFGGDWSSFKKILQGIKDKISGSSVTGTGTGTGATTGESNWVTELKGKITQGIQNTFDVSESVAAGALSKLLNKLTSSLGEAGGAISELAQNMAMMGPLLGAIVTAIEYVIEGFGEVVSGPLNEFVQYIIEPLRELGRIAGDLFIPLLEKTMPLVQKVADFSIRLFNALGVVLEPVIEIINSALAPILDILVSVLEALTPVLKIFAKIMVTVTGTIQYIIQTLQHWVATILNWLAGLSIFGWHPFGGLSTTDPGSPGSYSEFIRNKWSSVDAAFERSATGLTGTDSSTQTAVTNASYSGATTIHLNVYQNGVVVGDGGITQFAYMIRNELENLNYLGR